MPPPATAIAIAVGADANTIVGDAPIGASFVFAPGTHRGVSIVPKQGQRFFAAPGSTVVLDGVGKLARAFSGQRTIADVQIYGLAITGYAPGDHVGVVDAGNQAWTDPAEWKPATSWLLCQLSVHDNGGHPYSAAIDLGSGSRALGGRVWNNTGVGITGSGHHITVDGVLVENNSLGISLSPVDAAKIHNHSGGMKFTMVHDSVVRRSTVRGNHGPGIWFDINCDRDVIESNVIEDNALHGVHYEISRAGVIRGNTIRRNAFSDQRGWLWGAGILISTSEDVRVTRNTLADNLRGLIALDQRTDRNAQVIGDYPPLFGRLYDKAGKPVPWAGRAVRFLANTVVNSGDNGVSASLSGSTDSDIYTTSTFEANTYSGTNRWWWGTGANYASQQTFAAWQAAGRDD